MGASFPHAFVILEGTPDRGGARIKEDYGFTAKTISPAILWGKVAGEVITDHTVGYVKGSDRHFTVVLADPEYDAVMATIARWRATKQPNYDLDRHNCVHFVADLAAPQGPPILTIGRPSNVSARNPGHPAAVPPRVIVE